MDVKVVWSSLRVETWTSARRTTPGVITSARTRAAAIAVAATPATVSTPPTGAPAPADRRRSTTTMGDSTRAGTPHVYRIGHLKTDRNAGEILRGTLPIVVPFAIILGKLSPRCAHDYVVYVWDKCGANMWNTYRVDQKSKLLILSEYVNKTEKIGGMWTNTNSYRENEAPYDIFAQNILRLYFMFKYSMTESSQWNCQITARQTQTWRHKSV